MGAFVDGLSGLVAVIVGVVLSLVLLAFSVVGAAMVIGLFFRALGWALF